MKSSGHNNQPFHYCGSNVPAFNSITGRLFFLRFHSAGNWLPFVSDLFTPRSFIQRNNCSDGFVVYPWVLHLVSALGVVKRHISCYLLLLRNTDVNLQNSSTQIGNSVLFFKQVGGNRKRKSNRLLTFCSFNNIFKDILWSLRFTHIRPLP